MKQFFPILLSLLLISCQYEKTSIIDPVIKAPYLSTVFFDQNIIDLDNDTTSSVDNLGDNRYKIKINFRGIGSSEVMNQPISGTLQIYKPSSPSPFSTQSFQVESVGTDSITFSSSVTMTINRGDAGAYRLTFSLKFGNSSSSNSIEKRLFITRNNSRPQLLKYTAPDTLIRPTTGIELLFFNVTVNDSDGYNDLDNVYIKRIYPTETSPIYLFDDGDKNRNGDNIALDGIFSRILSIDSTARLGNQIFLFRAIDKSGAFSDSLLHTITVLQ
ncbi:MAG: hypothetical protein C0417_00725 [Chlorobiaceae bacterium]|nr:hypothetical protein [Chlorobiaceae bacterium]